MKKYFIIALFALGIAIIPRFVFAESSYEISATTNLYPFNSTTTDQVGSLNPSNSSNVFVSGILNYAYSDDGTNQYLMWPTLSYGAESTTISFWFQSTSTSDEALWTSAANTDGSSPICEVDLNIAQSGAIRWDGSVNDTSVNVTDGSWHNLVIIQNNSTWEVNSYVDGTQWLTNYAQGSSCFQNYMFLGYWHGQPQFTGNFDDTSIAYGYEWTPTDISSVWNGGAGAAICTTSGCSSSGASSSLQFVFPTQGTSTGVFSPYQLSLSTSTATDQYITRVQATICTAFNNCVAPVYTHSGLLSGSQIAASGIQVPALWSSDYQNNVIVNATATLQDETSGYSTSTFISYTLLSIPSSSPSSTLSTGGIFIITTSTGNGTYQLSTTSASQVFISQLPSTSTSQTATQYCVPPQNSLFGFFTGADAYYAACSTIVFLFVPNQTSNDIMTADVTKVENVPPFSWFFLVNNQIAAGASDSSTSITPNNGVSFTIYNGISMATSSLTVLPANLTSNSFLSDGVLVDDYYNFILTALILVMIILTYKIIL